MRLVCFTTTSRLKCFQSNHHPKHGEGHKIIILLSCKSSWKHVCHLNHVSLTLMWAQVDFHPPLKNKHVKYQHCLQVNLGFDLLFKIICLFPFLLFCDFQVLPSLFLWSYGHMFLVWKVTWSFGKIVYMCYRTPSNLCLQKCMNLLMKMMTMMILLLKIFANSNFHLCCSA